jgi:hypothetical protein
MLAAGWKLCLDGLPLPATHVTMTKKSLMASTLG